VCRHQWLGKPTRSRKSPVRCPKCNSRRVYQTGEISSENGESDIPPDNNDLPLDDYEPAPILEFEDDAFTLEMPEPSISPPPGKVKEPRLTARQMHELKKRSQEGIRDAVALIGYAICAWRNWAPPEKEEVDKLSMAYLNCFPTETGVGKALQKIPVLDAIMLTVLFFFRRIFGQKLVKDATTDLTQGEPESEEFKPPDRTGSPFTNKLRRD